MNYNMPDYFSHKLELKLDKLPAKTSDRTNWRFILPGLIFGALLFFLGTYEFFNGFRQPKSSFDDLIGMPDALQYQPLINPTFFDIVFILIGLGMIAASITSYIRYKKSFLTAKRLQSVSVRCWARRSSFAKILKLSGRPLQNRIFPVWLYQQKQVYH